MSPKNTTSTTNTDSMSRRLSEGARQALRLTAPGLRAISLRASGEAVAASAQGFDGMQRFVGIELAAQAPDEHLDDVAVALEVLVVEPFGELGLRDHVAGAQHHVLEDAVFERGELDRRCRSSVTACARVSRRIGPHSRIGRGPAARAAQQRLHARQHFFEVIGLRDVVVGAGLQAFDLVLPAIARREDEDRKFLAGLAQAADEIEPGKLRQAEIDDGDVERIFLAGEQAFLAIGGDVDREALLHQLIAQAFAQRRFVLDHQCSHAVSASFRWRRRCAR